MINNDSNKRISDIESARIKKKQIYKKKKKERYRQIVFFIILFLILNSIIKPINILKMSYNRLDNLINKQTFPVNTNSDLNNYIYKSGDDGFVITDTSYFFINKGGNIYNRGRHNFSAPLYSMNDDNIAIYQQNSNVYYTGNKYQDIQKHEIKQSILNADVAKDGKVAVVAESDRYLSEVIVFDGDKEIYRWSNANEYITSIKFSENSKKIYVTCLYTNNGILSTAFYTLDFNKTQETLKVNLENFFVVDFVFDKDSIILVGHNEIVKINKNGEVDKKTSYDNKLLYSHGFIDNNIVVFLSNGENSGSFSIIIFDEDLNKFSDFSYNDYIDRIYLDKTGVYLSKDNNIFRYDLKGNFINSIFVDFYFSDFIVIKGNAFCIANNYVGKISVNK
ncbi:MAG: DUF5711 family protein [Oscillospiraceae bacterium]